MDNYFPYFSLMFLTCSGCFANTCIFLLHTLLLQKCVAFFFFPYIPLLISPLGKEPFKYCWKQNSSARRSLGSTRTSEEGRVEQPSQARKHQICFLFPIFLNFVVVMMNMSMNIYVYMIYLINMA